jgi:hypothetical protein
MSASKLTRRLFWTAQLVLLAGTAAAAALTSNAGEWEPIPLVLLLLLLTLVGDWLSIDTPGGQLSCSLVAIVLAMSLLGPVPAAALGVSTIILTSAVRRLEPAQWLNGLSTFAFAPFAGGLTVQSLAGNGGGVRGHLFTQGVIFGLAVLGALLLLVVLNFVLYALHKWIDDGSSLKSEVRQLFLPLLPGELAAGTLAMILAVAYAAVGLPMLFAAIAVLLILRQLTVALLRSEERAEQLEARSIQLVGLQMGVLTTLVRALGKRDKTTGRHAAAVAQYANALAIEVGCSEDECNVIRAAGLLHEIGKFTWPDRVLHADVVQEADLEIVKNHPQEGAVLVGALDGYGPVADAILYHHERVDGRGYPAGLIGSEIPLASRILAVCSAYDTMTARESYREPMAPPEAIAELKRAAQQGQFDQDLVDSFLTVLDREGQTFARDADFETELELERRVREMAEPRSSNVASSGNPAIGKEERPSDWRSKVMSVGQRARYKH